MLKFKKEIAGVQCSDGLNTMFILEDFYKGPFIGKVSH